MEKIMLGAGCFWGVEHAYKKIAGVKNISVGYSGGETPNPTYEQVCSSETGHAEVVFMEYDSSEVSLNTILDKFWTLHDPTSLNKQGPDIGTQYRSAIFYFTPEQKNEIDEAIRIYAQELNKPIVTEVSPAKEFWRAEEYHQCYLEKSSRV